MTRQPDETSGDPLDGLDDRLAALTRETVEILEGLPKPTNDIEAQRRSRAIDFLGRCIATIRKLRTETRRPKRPQDEDDMNDAHTPDDAEARERKFLDLDEKLDRFARRHEPARAPDDPHGGGEGLVPGPLVDERQPRAA